MTVQKFNAADRAVVARMNDVMLRELTRADREDRKLFAQFSRSMDRAITARQRELDVAVKEINRIMRKHNITAAEVI